MGRTIERVGARGVGGTSEPASGERLGSPSIGAAVEISVIIPCFNACQFVAEQLEALAEQEGAPPFEVVVVDDGSTDDSVAVVLAWRPRLPSLRLLEEAHRGNVSFVRNLGVAETRGRLLLFCDADDVVDRRWVANLASALEDHEFVAGALDFERLNPPWMRRHADGRQQHGLQMGKPGFLPHAGAGNLGIHREVFDALGGFDASLPSLEDTDLCFRAQLRGHQLTFTADALVHVRQRQSLAGAFRQGLSWGHGTTVLHHRFRRYGMAHPPHLRHLAGWLLAVPRLFLVRDRAQLATWVFRQGWRIGRLQGVTLGFQGQR
jgi:glycosyltransferase involved in cell wall biosynthesis